MRGLLVSSVLETIRVVPAVLAFAQALPYRVRCSDDLAVGLQWAKRNVAMQRRELAPDPPGWKTALRFDVDCVCDRRPHAKAGYCPRAATYWREANVAEPSFVVVNPANGHAHYVYLLRGWVRVDGANAADLAAVRYFAAIEGAYTRALRADAGYAGLVQHNPFHRDYEAVKGRDEPYSLGELAAFVELPRLTYRRALEIRTDGRNIETFDRLRFWAYAQISEYRCGPRDTWDEAVNARALAIAEEVRAAHRYATHAYTDSEALDTAKSVAGWVWLRYSGGSLTRVRAANAVHRENARKRAIVFRRARGALPRDVYLAQVQARRVEAHTLRGLGVAVDEIARRLSAGVRSVQRWLSEFTPRFGMRHVHNAPSDFAAPGPPKTVSAVSESVILDISDAHSKIFVDPPNVTAGRVPVGEADGRDAVGARSAQPSVPTPTAENPIAYIRRRIRELVSGMRDDSARPP